LDYKIGTRKPLTIRAGKTTGAEIFRNPFGFGQAVEKQPGDLTEGLVTC